jgi:AraC-like DNA-binding protein
VLGRINDSFVHSNAAFAYRESALSAASDKTVVLETQFFDRDREVHNAHLLAYLHLIEEITMSSAQLIDKLCAPEKELPPRSITEVRSEQAKRLAARNNIAARILTDLGLWDLKALATGIE